MSVYAHLKTRRDPILHEGLILLIMEYVRFHTHAKSVKGKEKAVSEENFSSSSKTNVDGEAEWNEEGGSLSPMAASSKKRKKGTLRRKDVKKLILQDLGSHGSPSNVNVTDIISDSSQSKENVKPHSQDSSVAGHEEVLNYEAMVKEVKELPQTASRSLRKRSLIHRYKLTIGIILCIVRFLSLCYPTIHYTFFYAFTPYPHPYIYTFTLSTHLSHPCMHTLPTIIYPLSCLGNSSRS